MPRKAGIRVRQGCSAGTGVRVDFAPWTEKIAGEGLGEQKAKRSEASASELPMHAGCCIWKREV